MHIYKPDGIPDDVQFTGDRALLAADSIDLSRAVVIYESFKKWGAQRSESMR